MLDKEHRRDRIYSLLISILIEINTYGKDFMDDDVEKKLLKAVDLIVGIDE